MLVEPSISFGLWHPEVNAPFDPEAHGEVEPFVGFGILNQMPNRRSYLEYSAEYLATELEAQRNIWNQHSKLLSLIQIGAFNGLKVTDVSFYGEADYINFANPYATMTLVPARSQHLITFNGFGGGYIQSTIKSIFIDEDGIIKFKFEETDNYIAVHCRGPIVMAMDNDDIKTITALVPAN